MGRVRERLAKKLQQHFPMTASGVALTWEAERLYPATGAYRTNVTIDCCRWEGFARHYRADGTFYTALSVHSYTTMSELLKAKELQILSSGDVCEYNSEDTTK